MKIFRESNESVSVGDKFLVDWDGPSSVIVIELRGSEAKVRRLNTDREDIMIFSIDELLDCERVEELAVEKYSKLAKELDLMFDKEKTIDKIGEILGILVQASSNEVLQEYIEPSFSDAKTKRLISNFVNGLNS